MYSIAGELASSRRRLQGARTIKNDQPKLIVNAMILYSLGLSE